MEYVIGIDGGGTNYRVRACGLDGKVLSEYNGIPARHYLMERTEMIRRVNANIDACLAAFGGKREDCRYLLCGISGIDSEEDGVILTGIYEGLEGFDCPVECMNDAELAHYAVTGGEGLLVISGTGSIAFGTNKRGESARVGGWMLSIMGEEGSGSWVSRKALRHLGRWFDKAVPDSLLTRMLLTQLNISTAKQLMDLSAHITAAVKEQCHLAPIVDEAANKGDEWAIEILQGAAAETMGFVRELVPILGLDKEPEFKVGIWGSNIVESNTHRETFRKLLYETYPSAVLYLPMRSAVEEAARLALERLQTK